MLNPNPLITARGVIIAVVIAAFGALLWYASSLRGDFNDALEYGAKCEARALASHTSAQKAIAANEKLRGDLVVANASAAALQKRLDELKLEIDGLKEQGAQYRKQSEAHKLEIDNAAVALATVTLRYSQIKERVVNAALPASITTELAECRATEALFNEVLGNE